MMLTCLACVLCNSYQQVPRYQRKDHAVRGHAPPDDADGANGNGRELHGELDEGMRRPTIRRHQKLAKCVAVVGTPHSHSTEI